MNDQLEGYRKRKARSEETQPRAPMAAKDWATLTMSVIALVLAGTTTYFNFFRQTERLEAMVTGAPAASFPDQGIELNGMLELAFVNSGTRPIAVTNVSLSLNHEAAIVNNFYQCTGEFISNINFDEDAFVVRPSEVLVKKFDVTNRAERPISYKGPNVGRPRPEKGAVACLDVEVLTSEGYHGHTETFGIWGSPDVGLEGMNYPANWRRFPIVILDRTLSPFFRD